MVMPIWSSWQRYKLAWPGDLGVGMGTLTMTVKSAHIYQTELGLMRRIISVPSSTRDGPYAM